MPDDDAARWVPSPNGWSNRQGQAIRVIVPGSTGQSVHTTAGDTLWRG